MHPALCIDPSLGRLDYESLSDQARMEILIDGLTPFSKTFYQDTHFAYRDVCEWESVECDENENVESLRFTYNRVNYRMQLKGKLNTSYIPPHVHTFVAKISFQKAFYGKVDTAALPHTLTVFEISVNHFDGSVDFRTLPVSLQRFIIHTNAFIGSVDLTQLPPKIRRIAASHNKFSGSINLNFLPDSLQCLLMSANDLSGDLIMDKLPESMETIKLDDCAFSGRFELRSAPESLECFHAGDAGLSGTVMLPKDFECDDVSVEWNRITAVVCTDGKKHPMQDKILAQQQKK